MNIQIDGEGVLYMQPSEIEYRINTLEHSVYGALSTGTSSLSAELEDLRHQFNGLVNEFNAVLREMQKCARREELVDEHGGALDEFIEQFMRR